MVSFTFHFQGCDDQHQGHEGSLQDEYASEYRSGPLICEE